MESLRDHYRQMHTNPKWFLGYSIKRHLQQLAELVESTGSKTLLDYGSGKGMQYLARRYHEAWGGILPACYDPGVLGLDQLPNGPFDGVICNDVMEHVPSHEVQATLRQVISLATKFVFFGIATKGSHKTLPDGRDCHVTVRARAWWLAQVEEASVAKTISTLSINIAFTEDM